MEKMISSQEKQKMRENLFFQSLKYSEEDMPPELENKIVDFVMDEDWENLYNIMLFHAKWADYYCGDMITELPDEFLYKLPITLYTKMEGIGPVLAYRLSMAGEYGSPELPSEFEGKDFITIYRGGSEDPDEAPCHFSWTTDINKAIWFMLRFKPGRESDVHLYQGWIDKKDIIAYYDDRDEKEIIQFCDIQDLKELVRLTPGQLSELRKMDSMDEQVRKVREYIPD